MQKNTGSALEHDEFVKAPALFKYGPWSILIVGFVLSVATLRAGEWRVVEGRKGEYEKALVTARIAAAAATENFDQLGERLWQLTEQARVLQEERPDERALAERLAHGLGLRHVDVQSFAATPGGRLLPFGAASAEATAQARDVLGAVAVKSMERGAELYVPLHAQRNGEHWTAAVHRLDGGSRLDFVVHLVPSRAMLRVADRTLGPLVGRVVIQDALGRELLQASNVAGAMALAPPDRASASASTVAEAMAHGLDFESGRMLTASAAGTGRITASVGLREREVLREFRARVRATWLIIGLASACWMAMAALIAYALARFKRTEAYLRRLATTDILTDLPNRRSFHALLAKAVARRGALALCFLDLDDFKYVNDSMGHPVGDALLKHVAGLLRKTLRPGDEVCRLGGDEFTLLLGGIDDAEGAQAVGERILREVRTLFEGHGIDIEAKASIGVALMPQHASNETDLMRFADTALYRAKQQGKSRCVVYDDSMAQQALAQAQTVRELERAIAHDELFLVYQPKYHLASGTLTGHEALVRWQHPVRGLVFPGEFIALAESSGLIGDLGDWVLHRAVRQLREWHDQGHGWHKVAVNVSQLQLQSRSFVHRVQGLLAGSGVPGRCLQVEITESCLASDAERLRALVVSLRALGVTVAVDDFGTGYSSLSTLGQFEIDTLKVDRSFIDAILTKDGQSICRAILGLGQSLEMNIVAEGVESEEQAMALAALGCNEVQGYLYSKPVAPEVAVTLLKTAGSVPALCTAAGTANEPRSRRSHLVVVS